MAPAIEEEHVDSLSSNGQKLYIKNFIWSDSEWPQINYDHFDDRDDIPLISLQKDQNCEKVCRDMVAASNKWGFFKLVDHGVPSEIVENMKARLNEMFDLPMEEKLKGARSATMPLGYCATNPDYGKNLPWAELLQLLQSPQQVLGFAKKVFGDQHQPFRVRQWWRLQSDFFTKNFEEKDSTMIRINKYPPCPLPEKCLGVGSHTDPHTLTILLADNVGGLQVLKDDNQWVGIRPIPNSFVINIGDTLECMDKWEAKECDTQSSGEQREEQTINCIFPKPCTCTIIDSPPELLEDPNTDPPINRKYVPFTWADFRKELLIQKRVIGKTALNRYLISP
ncbi:unnamed protein product [Camellia sinensis]